MRSAKLTLIALAMFMQSIGASANDSVYTKLVLEDCTIVDEFDENEPGDSIAFVCHGHDGIPVYVAEGDLRFSVVPMPKGYRGPVRFETLSPFNTLGETLEWRRNGEGGVIATILRWFTESGDGNRSEVLVVTRVGADGVCHVAEIDAQRNAGANEIARELADRQAVAFRCGQDEVIRR